MALIDRLSTRTGCTDTTLLNEIIAEATEIYLACRYPTQANKPQSYEAGAEGIVLLMCIDIYNKIGAEGQRTHNENGVSRSYSGDLVSRDILSMIVPYCGVIT